MPSFILLVSFRGKPDAELRDVLRLGERGEVVGDYTVWQSELSLADALSVLADGFRAQRIASAAFIHPALATEKRWIAVEFVGKLVITGAALQAAGEVPGWVRGHYFEGDDIYIYAPAAAEQPSRAPEYRSSLERQQPVKTPYRVPRSSQDLLTDREWFGRLASDGGAIALVSMSHYGRDDLHGQEITLCNPAALNVEISDDPASLRALMREGTLDVNAVALGRKDSVPREFLDDLSRMTCAPDWDRLRRECSDALAGWTDHEDPGFRLLMYLEAPDVDPQAVIATGSIFEQQSLNGVQTLAAASPVRVTVDPGNYKVVALPAWCLNKPLKPPTGQPVSPTVLRYKGTGSQTDVWRDLAMRLGVTYP